MPTSLASPLPHPPAISAALTAPAPPRPPSRRGKAIDDLEMSTAVDAEVSDFFGSNLNPESAPPAETARERFSTKERVATRREIAREIGGALRAGGAAPPACAAADARLFLPAFSNNPDICPRRPLAADLRVDLQSGATRGVPPPRSSRDAARGGRRPRASLSRACPRADPVARCVVPPRGCAYVWRVPAGVLPLSAGEGRWPVRAVTVPPPCATATNSP